MASFSISAPNDKDLHDFSYLARLHRAGKRNMNLLKIANEYTLTDTKATMVIGTPGAQIANIPLATAEKFTILSSDALDVRDVTLYLVDANGDIQTETLTCDDDGVGGAASVPTVGDYVDCLFAVASAAHATRTIAIKNEADDETYITIAVNTTFAWIGRTIAKQIVVCNEVWLAEVASGASPLTGFYTLNVNGNDLAPRITNQFAPVIDCVKDLPLGAAITYQGHISTTSKLMGFVLAVMW